MTDAAILLGVVAGRDPLDPTSSAHRVEDFAAHFASRFGSFAWAARANIIGRSSTAKCAARPKRPSATWQKHGAAVREISLATCERIG